MTTIRPPRSASRARPLLLAVLVLSLIMVLLAGGALVALRIFGESGPLRTNEQQPAPAPRSPDDPAVGSISFVDDEIADSFDLAIDIQAPPGATEVQVGLDPSFLTSDWRPVTDTATLRADSVGHQMLFGRFRSGPDGPITTTLVDDVTIDPTYEAATSSADGLHRASWVRPMSQTTVIVRVESGRLERGGLETYDFDAPPPGDEVSRGWFGPKEVTRDGVDYGRKVDGRDDLLKIYDRLIGRPLDGDDLIAATWTVESSTDPAYSSAVSPLTVERITRAAGSGFGADGERIVPVVHDVVLRLDEPLRAGERYLIEPPDELVAPIEFTIEPNSTVSPAVHVNQNGYGPADPLKIGYLSGLFDEIGGLTYPDRLRFRVLDVATGAVMAEGATARRPGPPELDQGDLTGSEVFEMDFSSLTTAGDYRLCVDTVGCSEDFAIDDDAWFELATTVARSMYHQRSGAALGPPYSSIGRPRPYHPEDGMRVFDSSYRLIDSLDAPLGDVFDELVAGRGTIEFDEAWGGHFDAGDWDRRIQHLYYVRAVVEMIEDHPKVFAELDLSIPESGDAVPDLLDEGLWTLDLFRRLQHDDGSVPGGIEASEHPQADSTSWTDDLAVFTYAADPWTTYVYAGVAAQAAAVLRPYDPQRAATYLESAIRAMEWAEIQPVEAERAELVAEHRVVAAAALLKATGEMRWHDLFADLTSFADGVDSFLSCHDHGRCDAGWIYLSADESLTDPVLRETIVASFMASADEVIVGAEQTAFGWSLENRFVPLVWGLGVGGAPNATGLLRAYELSGDERYRSAALRSAAVSLGANPTNTVYLTGVGRNPVRHPLIVDTMNGGLPVWAGTPVYGNHQIGSTYDESWVDEFVLEPAGVSPLSAEVPYLWQWQDVSAVAMFNEYTVFQSHAQAVYVYGLLAAAGRGDG